MIRLQHQENYWFLFRVDFSEKIFLAFWLYSFPASWLLTLSLKLKILRKSA
jgi:hypothetical protein